MDKILRENQPKSLLRILQEKNEYISAPCNGNGTCGKCVVRFQSGATEPSVRDREIFSEKQLEEGYRLACQSYPTGVYEIEIPQKEEEIEVLSGWQEEKRLFGEHGKAEDRTQTQLGQDTCQNTGDTQSHMEDTCYHACQHTDNRSRYQSNRYIMPGKHHHNCNGAACRNAAVYGHIRKIQYLKGDVNADGKNTPNQPLGDGARKGIEQCHNIHKYTSFYAFFFYRNKRSTCFAYSCI